MQSSYPVHSENPVRTLARSVRDFLVWEYYRWRCPLVRAALQYKPAQDLLFSTNVSPRYRYVYLGNPKTGTSSLKSALADVEARGPDTDMDRYDMEVIHNTEASPLQRITCFGAPNPLSYLVDHGFRFFTFVRNPYHRLLSCYRDKILNYQAHQMQKPRLLRAMGRSEKDLAMPITFEQFIRAIVPQSDYQMDPHWRPQTSNTLYEVLDIAFIGRFERYSEDFAAVFEWIGVEPDRIPRCRHLNRSGAATGCAEFYTQELRDLVYQRYEKDFINFSYDYDLPD
ncbi:sulfotransferase family protein [Methylomagnum ishizawai]|uniref:sulfotransferase family protein n=1 Tax=Methylomagnum ishizawai TaxID=1760988 RepID=UPI001C33619A|nr:sulfotransferase family protein [Methylomagnum ishizawai]BBL76649.1 hypothetical protein MishRS11D_37470 [Methylomagnum ishizawai]